MDFLADTAHPELLYRFGVALVIGFLVGLQREFAGREEGELEILFGGVRTFSLLGLFGCAVAYVGSLTGSFWPMIIFPGAFALLLGISYYLSYQRGNAGITSEIAALMVIIIGILCFYGEIVIGAALGVVVAVVLALKLQTRALSKNISRADIYATLQFAVITVIILPILPAEAIAPKPFDVLIPQRIWLMVVFISGISFLGYILIKIVGTKRALSLTGILGGLASSTAVTLSFSQKSREEKTFVKPIAYAILLAWCIMFIRVIIEVTAVNAALLKHVLIPLIAGLLVCLAYAIWLYFGKKSASDDSETQFKNPFRLGPAILFGLIYAAILLFASIAQTEMGQMGVYLSSIVSALVDVDAITLSMSELSKQPDGIPDTVASRAIIIATVTNTFVKGGIVFITGSPKLGKVILPGLLLTAITTLVLGFVF